MNMKRISGLLFFIIVLFASTTSAQQKEIVGYYPSWKWRYKNAVMTYDKIPFKKLTIIDYAFWRPRPDGGLEGINPKGDSLNLKWGKGSTNLVSLAHENKVKVMLSIGGWDDSGIFPTVASTEALRVKFAHACVDVVRKFDFDGIDIDWEYPAYAEHNGTAADRPNSTRLLELLRDSLDNYGMQNHRKLLLSAALAASADHVAGYEVDKLAKILDMLNIMTYDYNGPWTPLSGHNSPLYASPGTDTLLNVDASFKLFAVQLGVPASKINLGVPFYGHSFAQCTALNSGYHGSDTTLFPDGDVLYHSLPQYVGKYRHWDDKAKVPYLIFPEAKTLVSYDDEESIGLKAQYIVDHKARGVIIWEITGDYMEDGKTPLLDALNAAFSVSPGVH